MITAFAGPKSAEGFLNNVNWRWGFGAFAIIVPAMTLPLFVLLKMKLRQAEREGRYVKEKSGRSFLQRSWHGVVAFDCEFSTYPVRKTTNENGTVPGVFLFAAGLTVFLLPFTLAASAPDGWRSDYIIAMIVTGFAILVLFGLYEKYLAREPFLKSEFLTDRTIVGCCLFNTTYQISYYCWNSYFTSFLQVVVNLTVSEAGYVNSTFQVVSGVLLFIVGYLVRRTQRYKWIFYWTVPLYLLGLGLMIHFRRPNQSIGYIIMCEIFISMGGSVFILLVQLGVLAAVDHQHVAAVLAALYVTGTVGGAIGNTISGTIWTNTFLGALQRNLPESAVANATIIYADLETQLSYPINSPERLAIQESYGFAQTRMLAAGVGVMGLSIAWVLMLRNLDLSKKGQTKGMVF
jgi:hypothetical protein